MSVVIIKDRVTQKDIRKASEEYGVYIKVVVDIEKNLLAAGGEWHADAEKILVEKGSKQKNLWGGGIDLNAKNIETVALINLRPNQGNNSQEILDAEIREKFLKIVKEKFRL